MLIRKLLLLLLTAVILSGWTHGRGAGVAPSATTFYFNPSGTGTFGAGCLISNPCPTIHIINTSTFPLGNIVLIMEGSFSDECLTIQASNFANASSTTMQPGGSGYTITAACSGPTAAITIQSVSNVTITGGTLVGNNDVFSGVYVINPVRPAAPMANITIDNMTVSGFWCTIPVDCPTTYFGSILFRRFAGDGVMSALAGTNNVVGGSSPTSLDSYGVIFVNDVYDPTAPATLMSGVTATGNTVKNQGSVGGGTGSGIGGNGENQLIQFNVVHDLGGNNVGVCGGPAGIGQVKALNSIISFNSVYNIQTLVYGAGECDFDGLDTDTGSIGVSFEYNYVFHTSGTCHLFSFTPGDNNNTIRYNIYEDCAIHAANGNRNDACIWTNSYPTTVSYNMYVYNNTCYSTTGALLGLHDTEQTAGIIANNIFFGGSGSQQQLVDSPNDTGYYLFGNDYYQATGFSVNWFGTTYTSMASWRVVGGDPSGITTNPLLVSPGTGGVCNTAANPQVCGPGYKLQSGSAMSGTGINLTGPLYGLSVGSLDFYSVAIPNSGLMAGTGSGYNIGADGAFAGAVTSVPVVTAVAPPIGTTAGGTSVAVTGLYFNTVTSLKFGATNGTSVSCTSVLCNVTSPAGSAGTTDVTVTNANGTSATGYADKYVYGIGCSSYTGIGDLSPAASWEGLRAYSAAMCGQRFANVCVQVSAVDTCQDMVTSTSTGLPVPLSSGFGGTTCPNSAGTCTFKVIYDQTLKHNCSGPCDQIQNTVADRFQFLSGAAVCLAAPVCAYGTSAQMAAAAPMVLHVPFTFGVVGYFSTFNISAPTLISIGNAGLVNNGVNVDHYYYSCNFASGAGAIHVLSQILDNMVFCATGGLNMTISAYLVTSQTTPFAFGTTVGTPTIGSVDTAGKVILEFGEWNGVDFSNIALLGANRKAFWGY